MIHGDKANKDKKEGKRELKAAATEEAQAQRVAKREGRAQVADGLAAVREVNAAPKVRQ